MKKAKFADSETHATENNHRKSFFIYYIDIFFEFIYNAFFDSFLGKIFSSYSKSEEAIRGGFFYSLFMKNKKLRAFFRRIRKFFSKGFANSFIIKKLDSFVHILIAIPLRSYGNFSFSFGIYSVLIYFINLLIGNTSSGNEQRLHIGIIMCIIAIPLLLSSDPLAAAVYKGKITNFVFVKFFGFKQEVFQAQKAPIKHHSNIMIFLGMILGLLTLLIDPLVIVGALLGFIVLSIIIAMPESGVISSLFLLPFFSLLPSSTIPLALLILVSFLSFIIKAIQGKRILQLKLIDLVILLFATFILLSGLISSGGINSAYSAMISVSLILGYFLITNLMRSTAWLKRCISAFTSSAVIVSIVGLVQYLLGQLETNTIDRSYFTDIPGRIVSLFENSNVLGNYLAIIFPFLVAIFILYKDRRAKAFSFISIILVSACAILTWSRSAWLAIFISTIIFMLIYSRKTGRAILFLLLAAPYLSFLLPNNILTRLLSIGDISDSSTMYRLYTWKGTWKVIGENLLGGIGYGTDAFEEVYPSFAYAGIEAVEHSHSLFLQILVSMGLVGLVIFAFIIILTFQQDLEYIKNKPADKSCELFVAASFSSVVAAMIMGMFDYLWYNYRVFFLFWIILAISNAYYRIQKDENDRKQIISNCESYSMDAEISL